MKILIGIVSFILWSLVSIQWYVCNIKMLCDCDTTNIHAEDSTDTSQLSSAYEIDSSAIAVSDNLADTSSLTAANDSLLEDSNKESEYSFTMDYVAVHFPYAKTEIALTTKQKEHFKTIAKEVIEADANLILIGHADTVGTVQKNIEIGSKRATWVKEQFVKLGVNANKITCRSVGESEFKKSNNNDKADMKNSRRVDINVKPNKQ